jgi:hypothetical protein
MPQWRCLQRAVYMALSERFSIWSSRQLWL